MEKKFGISSLGRQKSLEETDQTSTPRFLKANNEGNLKLTRNRDKDIVQENLLNTGTLANISLIKKAQEQAVKLPQPEQLVLADDILDTTMAAESVVRQVVMEDIAERTKKAIDEDKKKALEAANAEPKDISKDIKQHTGQLVQEVIRYTNFLHSLKEEVENQPFVMHKLERLRTMCLSFVRAIEYNLPSYMSAMLSDREES